MRIAWVLFPLLAVAHVGLSSEFGGDDDLHDDELDVNAGEVGDELEGSGGACNKDCSRQMSFVSLESTPQTGLELLYYRSRDRPEIGQYNNAQKVVLVFHGIGHNPKSYFCYSQNAVDMAGASPAEVSVFALGFLDEPTARGTSSRRRRRSYVRAAWWPHHWDWMYGRDAAGPASSFMVLDELLRKLSDRSLSPSLREIVLLGHGGGAQMLHRYAAGNMVDPISDVKISYVVANPSTFLYFTNERLVYPEAESHVTNGCEDVLDWADPKGNKCADYELQGWCDSKVGSVNWYPEENCCACGGGKHGHQIDMPCDFYDSRKFLDRAFSFAKPDPEHSEWLRWASEERDVDDQRATCDDIQLYPNGPNAPPSYFPHNLNFRWLAQIFRARNVVYLSAYDDSCNNLLQSEQCGFCCETAQIERQGGCTLNGHELKYPVMQTCSAIAQGSTRTERAYAYWAYLQTLFGPNSTNQIFMPVEGEHSSCEIFQSKQVREFLFPPEEAERLV